MKDLNPPNALDAIIARYDGLADAEKVIADYILGHSSGVGLLSATQIAQRSGTSNATVSRFCRALGYENLTAFRYALSSSAVPQTQAGTDDRASNFTSYYCAFKSKELADTAAQLNNESMGRAHDLLVRAGTVYVVGDGPSLWLAQDTAEKLRLAGMRAFADVLPEALLHNASTLASSDVLIALPQSAKSDVLAEACEAAVAGGADVIVVGSCISPRLERTATVVLPTVSRDRVFVGREGFSSTSAMFVIEALVCWVFHSNERLWSRAGDAQDL